MGDDAIQTVENATITQRCRVSDVDIVTSERALVTVVSTDDVARDHGVLLSAGARLKEFEKNPVFLWSHDRSRPAIGSALWTKAQPKKEPTQIVSKLRFAETDEAEQIRLLFEGGHLRAFSISWTPYDQSEPTEDELRKCPKWKKAGVRWVGRDWELEEISAVNVPALTQANVGQIVHAGIVTDEFCRAYLGVEPKDYEIKPPEPEREVIEINTHAEPEPDEDVNHGWGDDDQRKAEEIAEQIVIPEADPPPKPQFTFAEANELTQTEINHKIDDTVTKVLDVHLRQFTPHLMSRITGKNQ